MERKRDTDLPLPLGSGTDLVDWAVGLGRCTEPLVWSTGVGRWIVPFERERRNWLAIERAVFLFLFFCRLRFSSGLGLVSGRGKKERLVLPPVFVRFLLLGIGLGRVGLVFFASAFWRKRIC